LIRSILVALDGSARARGVFAAAAELAERFDAHLHLFRAVALPPEFPPAGAGGAQPDELAPRLEATAQRQLEAFAAGSPRAVVEPPHVGTDAPWRAILDAAERLDVDLVVLGSHGFGGLDRLLGTTAGKVANHSRRDVYIVHRV
jgi:nucleotide-binding universal stress UspA family protein